MVSEYHEPNKARRGWMSVLKIETKTHFSSGHCCFHPVSATIYHTYHNILLFYKIQLSQPLLCIWKWKYRCMNLPFPSIYSKLFCLFLIEDTVASSRPCKDWTSQILKQTKSCALQYLLIKSCLVLNYFLRTRKSTFQYIENVPFMWELFCLVSVYRLS